eukprot:TRINITY_DN230_c1_g2_i1.p2 TRINITY_DN230_c1_g2~~TRINITY_DN230_c1_g2_i1.p2  ORF type:complete len:225 (-),score=24.31 TRINITY_DN230_c1_g2_i1:1381-2055(-)
MYAYKDYQEERLSIRSIILLTIFSMLELAAIGLAIAATTIPEWIHTTTPVEVTVTQQRISVQTAGLWQICDGGNATRSTINGETFIQITSEECTTGRLVEDFYRSKNQFFENDMFAELILTRIFVTVFILFAVFKFITVLVAKCCEEPYEHVPAQCITCCTFLVNFIEGISAPGGLIVYGIILNNAIKQNDQFESVGDVWGIAYEMFLAATVFSFISNVLVCFI